MLGFILYGVSPPFIEKKKFSGLPPAAKVTAAGFVVIKKNIYIFSGHHLILSRF